MTIWRRRWRARAKTAKYFYVRKWDALVARVVRVGHGYFLGLFIVGDKK